MTENRHRLRTALTAVLCVAALLAAAWFAFPTVRVGVLNFWLRSTGRDFEPTVTLPAEEAPTFFKAVLPEDLVLEQLTSDGVAVANAEYSNPDAPEERRIGITFIYGGMEISIDTEDLLIYEEHKIAGRDVIYEEKEQAGTVYRSLFISSSDPMCFVTVAGVGVTREELFTLAETLQISPLPTPQSVKLP